MLIAIAILFSQPAKIDLTISAAPLKSVVAAMSEKSGETLTVSLPLASEIMSVDAQGVELSDLMNRIANAVYGNWEKQSDRWLLTRDTQRKRDMESAEMASRRKFWDNTIGVRIKEFEKQPEFTLKQAFAVEDDLAKLDAKAQKADEPFLMFQEYKKLYDKAPANRLAMKLLSMVDLTKVCQAKLGENVVFSTRPTQIQNAFPSQARKALDDFSKEHAIWADAMAKAPERPNRGSSFGGDPRFGTDFGSAGPFDAAVVICTLANYVNTQIYITGPDGKTVAVAGVQQTAPWFEAALTGTRTETPGEKEPYRLSSAAYEFLRMRDLSYGPDRMPLNDEWRKRLLQPEVDEPLGFVAGEIAHAWAKRRKKHLVARLPDDLLIPYERAVQKDRIDLELWTSYAKNALHLEFQEDGDWLTIRPERPQQTAIEHTDRLALAKLARSLVETGMVRLNVIADYVKTNGSIGEWDPMGFYYASILLPRCERILQFMNWPAVRVYAELSYSQREAFIAGVPIPVDQLSPTARQSMKHLVYDGNVYNVFQPNDRSGETVHPALSSLPSVVAPNGIVSGMVLRGTAVNDEIVHVATPQRDNYAAWAQQLTAAQLAGALRQTGGNIRKEDSYWLGEWTNATMIVDCGGGIKANYHPLVDFRVDLRTNPTTYDGLPQVFKEKVKAAEGG
ncbi:MAG: hypothetical protein KF784_03440 [Fimbriimonadaceae bacterium]|nr:hypothetical protein [Fimbriimonadaceae bacterium]